MKKLLIALGVSAAVVSGSAMAAPVGFDAPKELLARSTGFITPSTCDYTPSSRSGIVEVELGKHEQNQLNATGATASVPFDFTFTQCPANHSNKKSGLKMWVNDSSNFVENAAEGLLKNASTLDHKAENAFVQIMDSNDNVLQFGKTNAVEKNFEKANNGTIKFDFKARLYAPNNDASSGEVMGIAPFVVEYK